ncbi:hypothetical protein Zmor_018946 [Zophobas morio]|uniref:Uncharacterized protein n=1 Tax=Zophobas morio TaxID=2755281 RepID=A0AA38IBC7_9CUCU|nr:hypothetical protein Zmor_018946 [Zophobas morio]
MKNFRCIIVFLAFNSPFVCATGGSAVITCYLYVDNSWEETQVVKNASTHQIKESCPENVDQTKRIKLQGSAKILYQDSLKDISKLSKLEIVNVHVEEIQPGTFKDLPKFNTIDLSDNNLYEIKTGTFVNLEVVSLFMHRNLISVLHEGAFQNLSNVAQLTLERNRLHELKRGVFQNVTVGKFLLGKNNISKIEIGAFADMFPYDEFGIRLFLTNNRFAEIDSSVFDCKGIGTLGLANNFISTLRPGDLRNLPNLYEIILTGNKIKKVPEGVFNGSKITDIILGWNVISVIESEAFRDMKHLQFVDVRHNKVKEWDSNWFRGAPSLIIIFSHNSLQTIPAEGFKNIPQNSTLYLDHNCIKNISDSAFNGITILQGLNLRSNELEEWNVDLLKNVKIHDFDLTRNKIECPIGGPRSLAPKADIVRVSACSEVEKK